MKIITHEQIKNLNISPIDAYEWVEHDFMHKPEMVLPEKISLRYGENNFFNTMPCIIPQENIAGVKVIHRHIGATPTLQSSLMLFDLQTGNPLALMESIYITALRTGAVAALSAETFAVKDYETIGFMGLGNTCYAAFDVLYQKRKKDGKKPLKVYLLKYKDQSEKFIKRFEKYSETEFITVNSFDEIIENCNVIMSCVSIKSGTFKEAEAYRNGVTIIPVHLNGFQNCDTVFDRVYCDDVGHVSGFKYFNEFSKRNFAEIGEVLRGEKEGRQNDDERILVYSVGLSIHDIYFAKKIYDLLENSSKDVDLKTPVGKIYY